MNPCVEQCACGHVKGDHLSNRARGLTVKFGRCLIEGCDCTVFTVHVDRRCQLTWDDVRAMRAANKAGVKLAVLSERYGVGETTIRKVIAGLSWADPGYVPGADRVCAECGETFRTVHTAKRFCSRAHRLTWNGRRTARRAAGKNPDGSETRSYTRRAA